MADERPFKASGGTRRRLRSALGPPVKNAALAGGGGLHGGHFDEGLVCVLSPASGYIDVRRRKTKREGKDCSCGNGSPALMTIQAAG